MTADVSSIWLVIGPALIAGGIGLLSAILSFVSARQSLSHTAQAEQAAQDHQLDLLVYNHRFGAIETIWQSLFEVEQSRQLSDRSRMDVVRASVWLPEDIRQALLKTLLDLEAGNIQSNALRQVRDLLMAQTKTIAEKRDEQTA